MGVVSFFVPAIVDMEDQMAVSSASGGLAEGVVLAD
jgi:hypothetical protein